MVIDNVPGTAAVRVLREHGVDFRHHPYVYEDRGGSAIPARELGVNGGRRGYLVGMAPTELIRVLRPTLADIARAPTG